MSSSVFVPFFPTLNDLYSKTYLSDAYEIKRNPMNINRKLVDNKIESFRIYQSSDIFTVFFLHFSFALSFQAICIWNCSTFHIDHDNSSVFVYLCMQW